MNNLLLLLRSRPWLALGLLVAVLAAGALLSYALPSCGKERLVREASQAKAEAATAQASGDADHTIFRLDSAARAERAAELRRQESQLAKRDHEITTTRPRRLPLPAAGDLPREGAN